MIDFDCERYHDINDYIKLIAILRAPDGCPWDQAQTHESIRQNCLEEAYEVCEAIDEKDPEHLKEELGDLLMQVIFHAGIEQDAGHFDFNDVCDHACRKLIYRHPHVFLFYGLYGEFLYGRGGGFGVGGGCDHKFDLLGGGKPVQPGDKLLELFLRVVLHDLEEIVDKEMGDVIVSGVNTAQKAPEKVIGVYAVITCVYKPGLIGDVVSQSFLIFNADDVAVFLGDSLAYHVHSAAAEVRRKEDG